MALQTRLPGVSALPWFELAEAAPAGSLLLTTHSQCHQPVPAAPSTCQHHHSLQQPGLAPLRPAVTAAPAKQLHSPQPLKAPPQGTAAQLNHRLQMLEARGSLRSAVLGSDSDDAAVDAASSGDAGLRKRLNRLALRVGDMLQPSGEAVGDCTWAERTANVLTSLPFLALGWHMHRQRMTPEGRHHALSMAAVGLAATAYHASSGRTRRFTRKVDYWTIAYTSSAMTKVLFADSPGMRRFANLSLLAVPFRPSFVSGAHTVVMQAEFARQAMRHKGVRADLRRHSAATLLGLAAFFGEDLVGHTGYSGFVHSAWHCLASYSMYTINGLLAHKERLTLQRQLAREYGACGAVSAGGLKPLRKPVHSSASSLPSFAHGCGSRGSVLGDSPVGCSPGSASP